MVERPEQYIANFCPVCGEHYPYHHSGVEHDFESRLMKAYHARESLPEDDAHVIAIRQDAAASDRENAKLVASDDLRHLRVKEWSMGNGQCPVCCGCEPGFHSAGGVYSFDKNGNEAQSWYDAVPGLKDTEGHRKGCQLAARIEELAGHGE